MMSWPVRWRVFSLFTGLLLLCGCFQMENSYEEEKDPHFLDGKKKLNSMDYDGAIQSFEDALQANPRSAAAHFELGILYETRKADYGAAIYHYQRHIQLKPNSPMADVVSQHIIACKRELAKTVSVAVVNREVQKDLERLMQTNNFLIQRVQFLENELTRRPQYLTNHVTNWLTITQRVAVAAQPAPQPEAPTSSTPRASGGQEQAKPTARPVAPPSTATIQPSRPSAQAQTPPRAAAAVPASRNHQVRTGETLASISRRYGVSVQAIVSANPGLNPNKIKPGQTLNIPAR
jgi:LysM repeat protein